MSARLFQETMAMDQQLRCFQWGGGGQNGEVRSELLPRRVVCRHWISEKGATKSRKKERREEININAKHSALR